MRAFTAHPTPVFASLLTLIALATPTTASAEVVTTVEQPEMFFGFDPRATYHDLCGNGFLRQPPATSPQWTIDIAGVRVPGPPIIGSDTDTAQNGFACVHIDKIGAVAGGYTATFRYQSLPDDPPSVIFAQVAWYPGNNGGIVATEQ